jgi:prefoldin subunit 5
MADPAVLAQLQQLVGQLNALQQTVGNLQASNNTLTTRIATLEAENTTLTAATRPSRLKSRTSQETLRLAALPEVAQEPQP